MQKDKELQNEQDICVRESNIQWFPGHMAKARRLLSENLGLVDCVVELIDARIPFSSRNPEIDRLLGQKPRVVVANKRDLADEKQSKFWKKYFADQGIPLIYTDCQKGAGVREVQQAILNVMAEKIQRKMDKGMRTYTVKTMVVGIPNVGKSSFINKVAGKNVVVTGDKPGVTRGKQWLRMNDQISLLDTPGLLWPKFEDQRAAFCLAATGAIKDDVLDRTDITAFLLLYLADHYPGLLTEKYKIDEKTLLTASEDTYTRQEFESESAFRRRTVGIRLLHACAKKRGCLQKGGVIDEDRICAMILDDFRGGKIGRISLDDPSVLEIGGPLA